MFIKFKIIGVAICEEGVYQAYHALADDQGSPATVIVTSSVRTDQGGVESKSANKPTSAARSIEIDNQFESKNQSQLDIPAASQKPPEQKHNDGLDQVHSHLFLYGQSKTTQADLPIQIPKHTQTRSTYIKSGWL